MDELIECVPNISEARRRGVIDEIAAALSDVPGAVLLDRSSDIDHNRTVLTLAGSRQGLMAAVRELYRLAISHIDLRTQDGAHPRMGAVDVVPFIPVRGVTMDDCVALSRQVAETIASEFGVPTYLYAESAVEDDRKILANIRRGQFEGMTVKMKSPNWAPDFGPSEPHPSAGVSAVGARPFLIAYNLLLDTPDIDIAKDIAKAIRGSSGGLAYVQAIGLYLPDRKLAQVSMNLLRFEQTSLHTVQETVKTEASRRGAAVIAAEIVGLIPQAAMVIAAAAYLQIENWRSDLVLENAILAKLF